MSFFTDASNKDILTNVFAIIANVGIQTAWGPVQTMTIEMYPTVIRYILLDYNIITVYFLNGILCI